MDLFWINIKIDLYQILTIIMNPLQFLPQELENIIINYKEQLEQQEHKKHFRKTLKFFSDKEIYNLLNDNLIETKTEINKDLEIIQYQTDVSYKVAFKIYLKHHLDIVDAIMDLHDC